MNRVEFGGVVLGGKMNEVGLRSGRWCVGMVNLNGRGWGGDTDIARLLHGLTLTTRQMGWICFAWKRAGTNHKTAGGMDGQHTSSPTRHLFSCGSSSWWSADSERALFKHGNGGMDEDEARL